MRGWEREIEASFQNPDRKYAGSEPKYLKDAREAGKRKQRADMLRDLRAVQTPSLTSREKNRAVRANARMYEKTKCDECGNNFDDNPGQEICKTCEDWIVTEDPSYSNEIDPDE